MGTPTWLLLVSSELYEAFGFRIMFSLAFNLGLPRRNGNRHAYEIASMSLDLLSCCADIELTDVANSRIQLRIGLHTGKFLKTEPNDAILQAQHWLLL